MNDPRVGMAFDPYDLWTSKIGVATRARYYKNALFGKPAALAISLLDWLLPSAGRYLLGVRPRYYPITSAHRLLQYGSARMLDPATVGEALDHLRKIAVDPTGSSGWAWGLGFPWMSKNGLYGPHVPFITHTPYVMEALLKLRESPAFHDEAMTMLQKTWPFLESLKTMDEGADFIALSYAPMDEPRIVANANAYAAFSYSVHAVYGHENIRRAAREKAWRLIRWVVRAQEKDGSWFYYFDRQPGNFIDGFHSCFVVKNLIKVKRLLPELSDIADGSINTGFDFIRSRLYDSTNGLVRRFAVRSHRDPFRWDLYDQAEYLGLLIDFGLLDEARSFASNVERVFRKNDFWYCRIDLAGRRWGRDFLRWGIAPFHYHRARLARALSGDA
jgi:hypothetical protein